MAETTTAPTPKALTAADVRSIVRDELGKWRHDADHGADATRNAAQKARDAAMAEATP
ncbi:MAG: hypothetical protein NUW01_19225 [Gemmatimonadaceae bacterium]|nr:hypothetical protein [Gemmatimonadaceae bacterium]